MIWASLLHGLLVCASHFDLDCFTNLGQYNAGLATRFTLQAGSVPSIRRSTDEVIAYMPRWADVLPLKISATTFTSAAMASIVHIDCPKLVKWRESTKKFKCQRTYGTTAEHCWVPLCQNSTYNGVLRVFFFFNLSCGRGAFLWVVAMLPRTKISVSSPGKATSAFLLKVKSAKEMSLMLPRL